MLYIAGTVGGLCADYSLVCDFFLSFFFGGKRGREREEREEREED